MVIPIRGYLRDTRTRPDARRLSLYFDKKHRSTIPMGKKEPVVLDLDGTLWSGTMNSVSPNNDPYVHDRLTSSRGGQCSCTEAFDKLGLAEYAELGFELIGQNCFRLTRVVSKGGARKGSSQQRVAAAAFGFPATTSRADMKAAASTTASSFPFGDRTAILALAGRYWNLISSSEALAEQAFERELPIARKQGFLSKDLFVRLARWKSVRQTPNYESNDEAAIRAATARAFSAADERIAILALKQLRGVGLRTASALLQWMRPERFPILDVRVVGALGKPEPASYEDIDFYLDIAKEVRILAQRHALDLRTMDRALWAWHKQQGKAACA
jgi:hypothetical protein